MCLNIKNECWYIEIINYLLPLDGSGWEMGITDPRIDISTLLTQLCHGSFDKDICFHGATK
jgi:hypothetical protein